MKIQAVVASTFKDFENGWSYSDSALAALAESAQGKPVIFRKKKVGVIESGTVVDGKVIVTASLSRPGDIGDERLFLVPGGLTDFDTVGDIIDTCKAHQFFLTDSPSDETLTVIERINV